MGKKTYEATIWHWISDHPDCSAEDIAHGLRDNLESVRMALRRLVGKDAVIGTGAHQGRRYTVSGKGPQEGRIASGFHRVKVARSVPVYKPVPFELGRCWPVCMSQFARNVKGE